MEYASAEPKCSFYRLINVVKLILFFTLTSELVAVNCEKLIEQLINTMHKPMQFNDATNVLLIVGNLKHVVRSMVIMPEVNKFKVIKFHSLLQS